MPRRRTLVLVLATAAAAMTSAAAVLLRSRAEPSLWREVTWPLPLDPWDPGRAFRCSEADCGAGTIVTIRAKLGFCNCATGFADDDEIDRVGDLGAIASKYGPIGGGWPVQIGSLSGRARRYELGAFPGRTRHALGIAVSTRCDVVVATATADQPFTTEQESAVFRLLASDAVAHWAESTIGASS
jgi:hypothetical protein